METKHNNSRILRFPVTQIVISLLVCCGIVATGQVIVLQLLKLTSLDTDAKNLINGLVASVLIVGSYGLWFRYYEKRAISEFSLKGIGGQVVTGLALGAVLQSLTILVIYVAGGFRVITINPVLVVIPSLVGAFSVAVFEEVIVRGIIFRLLEKRWGSYVALAVSAFIFGAMHLANPNSSLLAATGLAIQAGLLLASAYIYSRSLWFPIAIHFAWNFTEAGIFGANLSGNALSQTWLTTKIDGPEWVTGGKFGPEGSVQATLFCLIATVLLLLLSHRQNKLIRPAKHR
jgi:uncharacterized protein